MLKRGKTEKGFRLKTVSPLRNPISAEKKLNIRSLLEKQYNKVDENPPITWEDMEDLQFYKKSIYNTEDAAEKTEEEEDECECLEDDCQLPI